MEAGAWSGLLDAAAIRRWSETALRALSEQRSAIDAVNVFPVADRDTGSNLVLTMTGAAAAVAASDAPSAAQLLADMARAAALSAHGNSGIILAQFLRGLATSLEKAEAQLPSISTPAAALAQALSAAADSARDAVVAPQDGTMLSVLRAAADSAAASANRAAGSTTEDVLVAAVHGARVGLLATTSQLEVLARAGVLDAGGMGILVLLESLLIAVTGGCALEAKTLLLQTAHASRSASQVSMLSQPELPQRYEVHYLLEAQHGTAELRAALAVLGDSITLAEAGHTEYAVHVHTVDPGAVIEAGIQAGRPSAIRILPLKRELTRSEVDRSEVSRSEVGNEPALTTTSAIVVIADGAGILELFRAGNSQVLDAAQVTIADILQAIQRCAAERVVLLPNSAAVVEIAAEAASQARAEGIGVSVVPTTSAVQGLAAVAVHDRTRRFDDDVIAMAEAAAGTRVAQVTIAAEESITYAGLCQAGDVLGLIDGEVVEIGSDIAKVGSALARRLIAAGGELVTILTGAEAGSQTAAEIVQRYVRQRHALIEVTVLPGGQRGCPLLMGVE